MGKSTGCYSRCKTFHLSELYSHRVVVYCLLIFLFFMWLYTKHISRELHAHRVLLSRPDCERRHDRKADEDEHEIEGFAHVLRGQR